MRSLGSDRLEGEHLASGQMGRPGGERADRAATAPDVAALVASRVEPERFTGLFDRYHAEIRRSAASRLGGERADDVAAETFLVAFRTRDRFASTGPGAATYAPGSTASPRT